MNDVWVIHASTLMFCSSVRVTVVADFEEQTKYACGDTLLTTNHAEIQRTIVVTLLCLDEELRAHYIPGLQIRVQELVLLFFF